MPKMKTHKGLSKRVKLTGGGKIKRKRCGGGHLMSGKSAKRRRRIGSDALMIGAKAAAARRLLGG